MKKFSKKRRKLNNKGLTLIEILIAMTLLTIAIVPMMRGFIQVNKYGEKGRNLQQCTTIAQTAMENCKAYNMTDIHAQMTSSQFFDGSASYMAGAQYQNNGTGEYYISNMTVDGRKIGMAIKLSPIATTKQQLTKYENSNERLDGIFVASKTKGEYPTDNNEYTYQQLEKLYFDEFLQGIADYIETQVSTYEPTTITIEQIRSELFSDSSINEGIAEITRTITIKAETDSSNYDKATVSYAYTLSASGTYQRMLTDGNLVPVNMNSYTDTIAPTTAVIYTNNNSKTQHGALERIYFYYYPAYNSGLYTENPCVKDKIIIDTESFKTSTGVPKNLDVYLIKQKAPSAGAVTLQLAEDYNNNYVEVKAPINGSAVGTVNLYHNLNDNIGDGTQRDDAWPKNGAISELTYNVASGVNNKGGLVETEQKELMYTVKITVYNNPTVTNTGSVQMTGEEILTLDGTKINW